MEVFNSFDVEMQCENGHTWGSMAYNELGGMFLVVESDSQCPECGEEGVIEGGEQ